MSEREEILECAIDDLTDQVNERDQIIREKEARIAELERSLSGLQRRLQERFEFALGQISSDLQAEYEHSMRLLGKEPVEAGRSKNCYGFGGTGDNEEKSKP